MPGMMDTPEELEKQISKLQAQVASISIDPYYDSLGINPYGPTVQKSDSDIQDLRNRHDDNRRDIEDIKNVTQIHDMRISQQDREIYDLREKVKEALAVLHHPGLIANRMLDKAESFIHTYKSVLTDKNGQTVEMIEVSKLNTMIEKLREAIKNG